MEIVVKFEDDADFFDRSSFAYYAAGLSARRTFDDAIAVTGVSLRVKKTGDVYRDDTVAHEAAMRMAKNIFPGKHFYSHNASIQRIVVENFKEI